MKRFLRAFLACGVLQVAAAADEGALKLLPTPLEMPRRIGPMVTDGAGHSYEDPRLGISYLYEGAGLLLTIYVYDAGVESIPDGPDSVPVCEQFEEAKLGVIQAGYRDVVLETQQMARLSPPADSPLVREAVFEMVRKDRPTISYVWITAVAKHFVKLRFSLDAGLRDEVPEARRAVLDALGEAIRPHLQPQDPKAEKPGTSMNFSMGDGSDDDMSTQMMFMALLGAVSDRPNQKDTPVCGGPLIPGFETELEVLRSMLTMEKGGSPTRFGKALTGVEAAGFLKEFVWVDLHRPQWGDVAPAGLALDGYKAWKKKNLKHFRRPNLGVIAIDHPRPLPLEP